MLPIPELTIYSSRVGAMEGHFAALAEGLKKHGTKVSHERFPAPSRTRHVACWGWRMGRTLRRSGYEVLVLERGYVGDRFKWTSLGWNGLNGRARFVTRDDPTRFETHFRPLLQPWRIEGEFVLLVGQVPGDASLGGMDLTRWYADTAREAAAAYSLPVRFRPHPVAVQRAAWRPVDGAKTLQGTLQDALAKAAVVVTFNSNTSVDAVLAGVPTVAVDDGTMARPVAGKDIGERFTPERAEWAARLAWCQWRMDEIRSGAAWELVRPQ